MWLFKKHKVNIGGCGEIHYAKSGKWCNLDKRPRKCVRLSAGTHIKSFLHLEEPIFYSNTHQSMRFAEITTALTADQINAEDGPIMGRLSDDALLVMMGFRQTKLLL